MPVSYTHLDVYKRQIQYAHQAVLAYRAHPPSTELVEALYTEGLLRNQRSDFAEAERLLSDGATLSKRLDGDPNPSLPRIYATLGESQQASLEYSAAEQSLRLSLIHIFSTIV